MGTYEYTTYSNEEKEIVKSGIEAIRKVLTGNDTEKKKRLLFCLDWFMDPYYGQDISNIEKQLILILQFVIISENETVVKEDALNLLTGYTWGPYTILETNIDKIEKKLLPDVLYLINKCT